MSESEFARLAPKMGLTAPARTRAAATSRPRTKKGKTFKKPGIFGGSGFLGLGKSVQKISRNPGLLSAIKSLVTGGRKKKTAAVGYRKTQRGKYRPTKYMEKASLSHGRPQLHFATNPASKHRKRSAPRSRKVLAAHYKTGLLERKGSPGSLKKLYKTVRRSYNPAPAKVFSEFRGKEVTRRTNVKAAIGTPATLAELGRLKELKLRGRTLKFRTGKLAADGRKRLHIVGVKMQYRGNPSGSEIDCGEILAVTYQADKDHIEKGVFNYVHSFGEGGTTRPHLIIDPEGYPKIEGGGYSITEDGIEG